MAERMREGSQIHDGLVPYLNGCPRNRTDCTPIARVASEGFGSFMCCGERDVSNAPVPTDVFRLCIKSTHKTSVDLLVNLDRRDAIDTASVLLGGLSSLAQVEAPPTEACQRCGVVTYLSSHSRYCVGCGALLKAANPPTPPVEYRTVSPLSERGPIEGQK